MRNNRKKEKEQSKNEREHTTCNGKQYRLPCVKSNEQTRPNGRNKQEDHRWRNRHIGNGGQEAIGEIVGLTRIGGRVYGMATNRTVGADLPHLSGAFCSAQRA